jgi:hypothetical protein
VSETVTDAAAAAFRDQMTAWGLDGSAALAHFNRGPDGQPVQPVQPSTPAPTQGTAAQRFASDLGPTKTGRLTPQQEEQAAATLSRFWTGDPAVLEAALRGEGMTEVDEAADTRTEAEKEFDATLGGAYGHEYDLGGVYQGHNVGDVSQLAKVDTAIRETLEALDFPPMLAKGFVDAVLTASETGYSAQTSDAGKQIYAQNEIAKAISATRATSREDFFATARRAFALIPPAVQVGLAERGAFENANVLAALFQHGQRIEAREGMMRAR